LTARARAHLGPAATFVVHDRTTTRLHAIAPDLAARILAGQAIIEMPDPEGLTRETPNGVSKPLAFRVKHRLKRGVLERIGLATIIDRLKGRAPPPPRPVVSMDGRERVPLAKASAGIVALGPDLTWFSAGLDWETRQLRDLWRAKRDSGFRYIPIVYDLIPIVAPHYTTPEAASQMTDYFGELVWLADHTLHISEVSRADFATHCEALGWRPPPSSVIPLGCDIPGVPDPARLPAALRGVTFGLFVSTIEPRKNHRAVYQAWDRLVRSGAIDPARHKLVFAGRRGWSADDLIGEIDANPAIAGSLIRVENADDALLATLYDAAAYTVLPSFLEGYGLPLMEAFAFGKPCVAADIPSLREIAPGLPDFIDPLDTPAWARAMARYSTDAAAREAASARVRSGHHPVTWDMAAERVFAAVREAAR
jgi:glycosyltransferase involved in cell wall biosynthesis